MSTTLHPTTPDRIIPVSEMVDGQIGVIVQNNSHNGTIVQRYIWNDRIILLRIGGRAGNSWSWTGNGSPTFSVRILKDGEYIKVTDNGG